jgi:hypothetical protein
MAVWGGRIYSPHHSREASVTHAGQSQRAFGEILLDIFSTEDNTPFRNNNCSVRPLHVPSHGMAATTPSADYDVTPTPFPAQTKTASSVINGTETTATLMSFADKILITVTQQGRLAHWVNCLPMDLI